MTISEARAALPLIVQQVADGEEVTITRHGEKVAVVVHPDALRVRRAGPVFEQAAAIEALLAKGRSTHVSDAPRLSHEAAEDLLAEVRASRSIR